MSCTEHGGDPVQDAFRPRNNKERFKAQDSPTKGGGIRRGASRLSESGTRPPRPPRAVLAAVIKGAVAGSGNTLGVAQARAGDFGSPDSSAAL